VGGGKNEQKQAREKNRIFQGQKKSFLKEEGAMPRTWNFTFTDGIESLLGL